MTGLSEIRTVHVGLWYKSYADFHSFIIKNSWGDFAEATKDDGTEIPNVKTGYQKINKAYFEAIAKFYPGGLNIVIPKDILQDPLGEEAVNPKISSN